MLFSRTSSTPCRRRRRGRCQRLQQQQQQKKKTSARSLAPSPPAVSLSLSFCIHYILILLTERLRVFSELPRQLNITSLASSSFFFPPRFLAPPLLYHHTPFFFSCSLPQEGGAKNLPYSLTAGFEPTTLRLTAVRSTY